MKPTMYTKELQYKQIKLRLVQLVRKHHITVPKTHSRIISRDQVMVALNWVADNCTDDIVCELIDNCEHVYKNIKNKKPKFKRQHAMRWKI